MRAFSSYLRDRPGSAAGHFFLGRSHLALGALSPAVRALRRALECNPEMAPAWGLLGLAFARARRFERAVDAFSRALRIDPQNPRLLTGYLNASLVYAIRLFHQGSLAESGRQFNEVLRYRDTSILPHLYLASIYRELGKENLALFHMETASRLSPDDPFLHLQKALILLAQGQAASALEEIRLGSRLLRTEAVPAGNPKEVLRFLAINLYREKRYREAIFYATKLLREAYDDGPLHALVAECYQSLGDLAKARNHFERALAVERESPEIRHGLLTVLWQKGDYAELAHEASRMLRRDPRDEVGLYFQSLALSRTGAPASEVLPGLQGQIKARGPDPVLMAELGAAYVRAGLPDLAEGWFLRTLKVQPEDPALLDALAGVYRSLGNSAREGEMTRQYLLVRPGDVEARKRLVRILLAGHAFGDAAEEIARLLSTEPDTPKLRSLLALCYRRSGRYGDALVLFRELLRGAPASEEHLKGAVYCLDKMGNRPLAMAVLRSFLKEHGESLSLVLILGVLQYQEKDFEAAAASFRKGVALSPMSWRANRNLGMVYRRTGNSVFAKTFLAKAAQYRKDQEHPRPAGRKEKAPPGAPLT